MEVNQTHRWVAFGIVVAVLVLGAFSVWYAGRDSDANLPQDEQEKVEQADEQAWQETGGMAGNIAPALRTFTSVKVAFLDTANVTTGSSRGCDKVVMVDQAIAETPAPLTAALKALFANDSERVAGGWFNYIARTNETLFFERATVGSGVAKIYLTGSLSGLAGVCDDPRAKIQIEETALQFPTVQRVELYLNGERTELQPSQK